MGRPKPEYCRICRPQRHRPMPRKERRAQRLFDQVLSQPLRFVLVLDKPQLKPGVFRGRAYYARRR